MKTYSKPIIRSCIFLVLLNLVCLGYNSVMYLRYPGLFTKPAIFLHIIMADLLFVFVSHFMILASVFSCLIRSQKLNFSGISVLVSGLISVLVWILHFIVLDQLEEAFVYGFAHKTLLNVLWVSDSIIIIFFLLAIRYFIILERNPGRFEKSNSIYRERIYVAMNYTGIACSVIGSLFVWDSFRAVSASNHFYAFRFFWFLLIILPYFCTLCIWIVSLVRDHRAGWHDEKQTADINRSGTLSLLVSLPLLLCLIIDTFIAGPLSAKTIYVSATISALWLILYLFVLLFTFSVASIYNYRRN